MRRLLKNSQIKSSAMESVMIHLKTKKVLKRRAEELADKLGITLTSLLNLSLSQMVEASELVIDLQPRLNSKTTTLLLKLKKEAMAGRALSPSFTDPQKALRWLQS